MRFIKKITHDQMWLRLRDGGDHLKVTFSRGGVRISNSHGMRAEADKVSALIDELFKAGKTYGQILDLLEEKLIHQFKKAK